MGTYVPHDRLRPAATLSARRCRRGGGYRARRTSARAGGAGAGAGRITGGRRGVARGRGVRRPSGDAPGGGACALPTVDALAGRSSWGGRFLGTTARASGVDRGRGRIGASGARVLRRARAAATAWGNRGSAGCLPSRLAGLSPIWGCALAFCGGGGGKSGAGTPAGDRRRSDKGRRPSSRRTRSRR